MFDKSTRTLMAMLFQRSAIREFSGSLPDGRFFTVSIHRAELWRDDPSYDGYIAGAYSADFVGDTLDETLNKMDAYLAAEAEVAELLKGAEV